MTPSFAHLDGMSVLPEHSPRVLLEFYSVSSTYILVLAVQEILVFWVLIQNLPEFFPELFLCTGDIGFSGIYPEYSTVLLRTVSVFTSIGLYYMKLHSTMATQPQQPSLSNPDSGEIQAEPSGSLRGTGAIHQEVDLEVTNRSHVGAESPQALSSGSRVGIGAVQDMPSGPM